MPLSRRDFLNSALAGSVAATLSSASAQQSSENKSTSKHAAKLPIIICAANGFNYLNDAYALLAGGGDTLDANAPTPEPSIFAPLLLLNSGLVAAAVRRRFQRRSSSTLATV